MEKGKRQERLSSGGLPTFRFNHGSSRRRREMLYESPAASGCLAVSPTVAVNIR